MQQRKARAFRLMVTKKVPTAGVGTTPGSIHNAGDAKVRATARGTLFSLFLGVTTFGRSLKTFKIQSRIFKSPKIASAITAAFYYNGVKQSEYLS